LALSTPLMMSRSGVSAVQNFGKACLI
jgi:hypothetical protein